MKKSLRQYIADREMQATGGSPENADFHSKGYRRYFEGYSEYKETLPNGKVKIRRIYTGVYHKAELSTGKRRFIRSSYCILFALAILLFFYSVTLPVGSNSCLYVTIPEAFSILGFIWSFYNLVNYLTAPCNMTVYEFRTVAALKRSISILALMLAATGILSVIYFLLNSGGPLSLKLSGIATLLLSAVCCLFIYLIEKRIVYTRFLSPNKAPDESNQIAP
jgi:hypothetical protein